MHLPEEYRNYKLPAADQDSIHFFSTNPAYSWNFIAYFEQTHSKLNKFKNIKQIEKDYNDDLNTIYRLTDVPVVIKEYAKYLKNVEKPSKAELKANVATRAVKRRKTSNQGIIFNGPINGGVVNATVNNASDIQESNAEQEEEVERSHGQESGTSVQEENLSEHAPNIVVEWIEFIRNHQLVFHPFSPESHNIIQSGNGISPRPYLDRKLYERHVENHVLEQYSLPISLPTYLDPVIDAADLTEFKKEIRKLTALVLKEEEEEKELRCLEFLEELLNQAHKMYKSPIDHNKLNEDGFNQLFIWPYLDSIASAIKIDGYQGYFIQGQPVLSSMSQQLKKIGLSVDEKSQYKSDGQIKLYGSESFELLLLETSGSFKNTDKVKINFDHHKGLYGILVMLKCIADEFSFASVAKFSLVKVFFLHAAGDELHLWSMRYDSDGLFDLWRESVVEVKPSFKDRMVFLPQLIKFCWNAKCLLEQSARNISSLKTEHLANLSKHRYNPEEYEQLSSIVDPTILKLTKEEDSADMGRLGPIYSPSHN